MEIFAVGADACPVVNSSEAQLMVRALGWASSPLIDHKNGYFELDLVDQPVATMAGLFEFDEYSCPIGGQIFLDRSASVVPQF